MISPPAPAGSGTRKSLSYSRTSAGTEWTADTQWMTPSTFRPSAGGPFLVSGSYVQWTSVTSPVVSSLTTPANLMTYEFLSLTSRPGASRLYFFGGVSSKSSLSI